MPVSRLPGRSVLREAAAVVGSLLVLMVLIAPAWAMPEDRGSASAADLTEPAGHLLISELLTGAASASDELIEIYNPTAGSLPLEGLELVYVTASGATITHKAAWASGAAGVPAGAHLLVANEAGAYAPIADLTYASGLAATGGSVALRIQGASSAIDAVGWGTAASTWLEGTSAPAAPVGSSLERLPGGSRGSGQDTDDNLVDFVVRAAPDPQNSGSPPITSDPPSPSPTPTPTATATPTPTPSATPSPTPAPSATPTPSSTPSATPTPSSSIAEARLLPNGTQTTITGVAVTSSAFTDGGGYLADGTGGIAVLLADGAFSRGDLLQVSGLIDDRYEQRTLRASSAGLVVLGVGTEPDPSSLATGFVGESVEGQLVAVHGEVTSSASQLSAGVAYDLDDGSGPIRVLVGTSSGIDTGAWQRGVTLTVVGVVGQRDASGTGTSGYRVQPRDAADIGALVPVPTPTPTPSPSPTPSVTPSPTPTVTPTPSPTPAPGGSPLMTIAQARQTATGTALRVRGVVTASSGLIDPTSAVMQDASGAILVRLSDDAGRLGRGQLVELNGIRSTKSGMLTLRVSAAPTRLGNQAEPTATRSATGQLGESLEAQLVIARGVLTGKPRRSSAGNISFGIDDGTGEIRVFIGQGARIDSSALVADAWVEVRGVLGQETTGAQPDRGYRIWPRDAADLRLIATPVTSASGGAGAGPGVDEGGDGSGSSYGPLPDLGGAGSAGTVGGSHNATGGTAASGAPGSLPLLGGQNRATSFGGPAKTSSPSGAVAHSDPGHSARLALGLLALALAVLVVLGTFAWRTGALNRILAAARQAVGGPQAPDGPVSETDTSPQADDTLPRLTVMRLPDEPGAR